MCIHMYILGTNDGMFSHTDIIYDIDIIEVAATWQQIWTKQLNIHINTYAYVQWKKFIITLHMRELRLAAAN